jgi:hypothetical protein
MFASIKQLLGSKPAAGGDGQDVLAAWAKAGGHTFKRVKGRTGGGFVVETGKGWRVELGTSQRPYILGPELRFRCDTGLSGDVQMIMVTKALAQTLESDVFSRFTNAMQTQIDNTLPDEMRWLAMHPKVTLARSSVLSRRFALFSNAEAVTQEWLDDSLMQEFEAAATSWWTDALMLVLTVNRGILTMRMQGQSLEGAQLNMVGKLFGHAAAKLKDVASRA